MSSQPLIGGLARTEPGCGSSMSRMTTSFEEVDGGYRIRGQKHWQAFSGSARCSALPLSSLAALASGFLKRISRDAQARAEERRIGPVSIADIGYAKYRLRWIESSMTICEAACRYLETELDTRKDMMGSFFAVQAIKTLCTDRMLASALHYQQLCGGEGYRFGAPSNISAQAALDARVFPIFDGNNDMLNQQFAEHCLRGVPGRKLSEILAAHPLTGPALAPRT